MICYNVYHNTILGKNTSAVYYHFNVYTYMMTNMMNDDNDKQDDSLDEIEEELKALMDDYGIDHEKAVQVKKFMDRDGIDADEAVEMLEE